VAASPPLTFGDISKYLVNLSHIIRNSEARFLITFPRIRKLIGSVLAEQNNLKEFILSKDIVREQPKIPGSPRWTPTTRLLPVHSGSTGMPKGSMLSHRALLSNCHGIMRGIDIQPDDVGVSWLPLFHDMGLIAGCSPRCTPRSS